MHAPWYLTKSEAAFALSFATLSESNKQFYFWTFTAARCCDDKEFAIDWNRFCTRLRRRTFKEGFMALRVFEPHEGGGERDGCLHCHLVCNQRLEVNELRGRARGTGIGRVMHVRIAVPSDREYLMKYLSKAFGVKRCRAWAAIGHWNHTPVSRVIVESVEADAFRAIYKIMASSGEGHTYQRTKAYMAHLNALQWGKWHSAEWERLSEANRREPDRAALPEALRGFPIFPSGEVVLT